ncbi:MAG: ANTAR domain-containing protein [Actinomycetota bacterium]|nr:ANTAR domain-containing protein [Actinomycetota bacterium]MDQ3528989.1 ANTAR domain-containing protein [Actinomycetota bacterium]
MRVVVEQAKGMIAQRDGSDVDAALERLRSSVRSNRQPLQEVARRVVDGVLRV